MMLDTLNRVPGTKAVPNQDIEAGPSESPPKFRTHHLPHRPSENSLPIYPVGRVDLIPGELMPVPPCATGLELILEVESKVVKMPYIFSEECEKEELKYSDEESSEYEFDLNILEENINLDHGVIFIIPGYLDRAPMDWQLEIQSRLRKLTQANIIIVGWNKGNKWLYFNAMPTTKIVARQISIFLHYLARINGYTLEDEEFTGKIEFIGHSLGAHISGFVGKDLNGKVGRIIGLDPAGPSFSDNEPQFRLDRSDAQLVEVIHTNADYSFTIYMGILKHVGHIDYYPNGGFRQPGCSKLGFLKSHHEIVREFLTHILDHNIKILSKTDETDRFRLLAFPSNAYSKFKSGESLMKMCPEILKHDIREISSMKGLINCSIPIDFLTPWQKRRKELEEIHKINFNPDSENPMSYYFYTQPDEPYVDSHMILKLKLKKNHELYRTVSEGSSTSESLYQTIEGRSSKQYDINIVLESGEDKNEISINQYQLKFEGDYLHLAIPVIPIKRDTVHSLVYLEQKDFYIENPNSMSPSIMHIFPSSISINIREPGLIELRRTLSEKVGLLARDWMRRSKRHSGEEGFSKRDCYAFAESLRLDPLIKLKRQLTAVYTTQRDRTSVDPDYIFMDTNDQLPSIREDSLSILCLHRDKGLQIKLYLDTVGLGPSKEE